MNIQTITKLLIDAGIENNEAKKELSMLLEYFCNYTEKDRLMGKELSENDLSLIHEKALYRVETKNPIQYIIGEAYFMGEYFKVTPDVLIPRDETEILVRKSIDIINENDFKDVLDIGTGSGCIACTIAKQTDATVLGVDISSDALRVALDNVTKLGINNRAVFRKSDLFSKVREEEKFDLIISNPPYIPIGTELADEVKKEPSIALFAEDNGLYYYKKIIDDAPKFLKKNGVLMFELGINESREVKEYMSKYFGNIEVIKDLANIDRTIYGELK